MQRSGAGPILVPSHRHLETGRVRLLIAEKQSMLCEHSSSSLGQKPLSDRALDRIGDMCYTLSRIDNRWTQVSSDSLQSLVDG